MWPLYAAAFIAAELGAAVGLGRFLRRRDDDLCALADVVTTALAEEKARDRFEHTLELLDAAETRMAEFGDEDLEEWGIELLHTDDADIAADEQSAEKDTAWSCCGHAGYYHGPEVPGCAECRCRNLRPRFIPPGATDEDGAA